MKKLKNSKNQKLKAEVKASEWMETTGAEVKPAEKNDDLFGGEKLDPKEEKMLDWILNGVVWFILGWLGLSFLLVLGGYFGLWK